MDVKLPTPTPAPARALDTYSKPSVAVAKQWHDTVILPRRKRDPLSSKYHLVEMGEDPTGSELFPVWKTTLSELTAFGIGIGLYFRMVVQLGCLFLVFALVSTPTVVYFVSETYSGKFGDRSFANTTIDPRIWGTAVCSRVEFDPKTNEEIHKCPLDPTQMYIDLAILVALALYVLVASILQRRAARFIDEQEQTASDYSVVIKDPDADAWDPDEWREYCSQFGAVKFVTVAVDNHAFLSALAHKRFMEEMLKMESTDETVIQIALKTAKYGPLPPPAAFWKRCLQQFTFYRDLQYWQLELYHQRQYLHKMIRARRDSGFPVWTVFVMFETEEAQRRCLLETTAGLCSTLLDSKYANVPEHLRFRGSNILRVEEPPEPSSVQWKFVGVSRLNRLRQQILSVAVVVLLIVGVYHLMKALKLRFVTDPTLSVVQRRANLFILAYALTFTDIFGCKILFYTHFLEHHQSKEREQLSYLNKLLVFRAFNSAVIIYLLMDFTDVLAPYNLMQIQAILIANITTTPLLQLLSLYDFSVQKLFGPYAKTQKKLNLLYSGTYWQLAERYTEITKTAGIALFFKPILPTGLVVVSVSMLVNYWVDKYCLLRKWKVPPRFDGLLARASRYHLLVINMAALVMMGHWYNGWPYDAKAQKEMANGSFALRQATDLFGSRALGRLLTMVFPFPRKGYGDARQQRIMTTVNAVIMSVISVAIVWLLLRVVRKVYVRLVTGKNKTSKRFSGVVSDIPSSQVTNLNAYVPSYESFYSDFPFLCVDLTLFDHAFINWTGDHEAYSLVNDVKADSELFRELAGVPLEKLFGVCKQYETSESTQLQDAAIHGGGAHTNCSSGSSSSSGGSGGQVAAGRVDAV